MTINHSTHSSSTSGSSHVLGSFLDMVADLTTIPANSFTTVSSMEPPESEDTIVLGTPQGWLGARVGKRMYRFLKEKNDDCHVFELARVEDAESFISVENDDPRTAWAFPNAGLRAGLFETLSLPMINERVVNLTDDLAD